MDDFYVQQAGSGFPTVYAGLRYQKVRDAVLITRSVHTLVL